MMNWMRNFLWKIEKGEVIYYGAEFPEPRNFIEFKNKFDEIGFKYSYLHISGHAREGNKRMIVEIEVSRKELNQFKQSLDSILLEWRNCINRKNNKDCC